MVVNSTITNHRHFRATHVRAKAQYSICLSNKLLVAVGTVFHSKTRMTETSGNRVSAQSYTE